MVVLIDPPLWPAHGTRFSHLVSDASLEELFAFADTNDVPIRAFDHDHYDVAERHHPELVAAGAAPVSPAELLRRLVSAGLRVRKPARTPKPGQVLPRLAAAWDRLLPGSVALGRELLERWQEPHRHYHDVRHLAHALEALAAISDGEPSRPVELALWFHDAVHAGSPGTDEERSAELAQAELEAAGLPRAEAEEVRRLVLLTAAHAPQDGDRAGAQVVDADLAVLGQPPGRYHYYVRNVRLEHQQLPDPVFAAGRLHAVERLLSLQPLYRTPVGRRLWSGQARTNLDLEQRRWSQVAPAK